jgi:hypothetical protein
VLMEWCVASTLGIGISGQGSCVDRYLGMLVIACFQCGVLLLI